MNEQRATILSGESIDGFRNWSLGKGQAANTAKAYSTDLRMFLKETGESEIPMVQYEHLAMYWLNLTRETAKPRTTGRRLTSLRAFGRWAGLAQPLSEYVPPTPGRSLAHPLPERFEGVQRMIDVAKNAQQKALVGLCGFAGLRVSEALVIDTGCFDLDDMILTVRGKGDKTRHIPVSDTAWSVVSTAYVEAMGTTTHRLVSYKDRFARKVITDLGVRAGLQRAVSSHDLRMTFGTVIYDNCLNIRVVQELLGHSSSVTTEIYTGISMAKMRDAVNL